MSSIASLEHRPLFRSALLSILPTLLLSMMVAVAAAPALKLSALYALKVLAVLIIGNLLILAGLPAHHPFHTLGAANRITLIRAALVALLAGLVGEKLGAGTVVIATALAIIAAALDGLDGWLARHMKTASAFGARFDMETDALMILLLSILVWQLEKVGVWVLLSGLMRYAYVAAGALLPWLRCPLAPSYRRKTIAAVQTCGLIIALAPFVSVTIANLVAAAALLALSYSFLTDIVWLRRNQRSTGFPPSRE